MAKSKSRPQNHAGLRKQAEEFLNQNPEAVQKIPPREIQNLVEELQIHQIELEMQNEELRRAQLELEAARDKHSDLYDFAPVGYFTINAKGTILEVNLTGAAMLGVERRSLTGKTFTHFITKETQDAFYLHRNSLFETKARQTCELKIVKKDGTQFHARLESIGKQDLEGNFIQARSVIIDITERKSAEKEKETLEGRLRQAQRMEAITALAGGIAHQFNNDLYTITGNLELLEIDSPDDENILKYAEKMRGSAHHMAQLTTQLLAYARGGKYQVTTILLSDFVKDTLPLLQHTLKPSIKVETNLPDGILPVRADLTQMQMMLAAILTNSSEAIEDQGRIRINCRNEIIADMEAKGFSGLKSGHYVVLTIEDDGKGMDRETSKRVFEPFFTTRLLGRGLGMAAVYGIVKNHDGWIAVDSEPGQGTKVSIYLPVGGAHVKKAEKTKNKPLKGTGTILLIEDEETVMDVSRSMLTRLGYRVIEAKTGTEAVTLARSFNGDIDVAILDIILPDIGGKDVYPLLMEARPGLKVIVCSGYSIDGPAQEILDEGAQDFIQKPFSLESLSVKLKMILEDK